MYFKKLDHKILENRIDADFYNPTLLALRHKVASKFTTSTLKKESARMNSGPFGSALLASSYVSKEEGVMFVRPQDCKGLVVDTDNENVFISFQDHKRLKSSQFKAGDIIITKIGNGIGDMAVVPENIKECNISGNAMGVVINKHDSYFAISFLRSKYGQADVIRSLSGGAKPKIDMESIGNIIFPLLSSVSQKYIGDKVRQAELLREWAKSLRKQIKSYFDNLFAGLNLSNPVERYGRVSLDNLVPRLNAEYYAEQYLQVEKYLKNKFGVLATIGELSPTVRSKNRPTTDCIYKEIGDLDTATGKFGQGTHYTYFDVPNNAQRVFDAGDVAVSTRRPNRGAIAVVEESSKDVFYSVFLARLKPKNKSFGYWLKEYLRHDAGKLLLLQRCTWTTYPVISEDDLETVPVPKLVDDWEHIAKLSTQSVLLEEYATKLTHVAKKIVEGLIEGTITEGNLVQAQNALEQGDTSLDRAILSQMTEAGYAVAGSKPLFTDLDEFYDLLEQAKALE